MRFSFAFFVVGELIADITPIVVAFMDENARELKASREIKEAKGRKVGDIVKIPLGDGTHTYAHALQEASFAVYNCRVADELAVERVVNRPVLFFVAVMHHAVRKGRWPIIGHSPLDDHLRRPPTFIQDPLNKNSFSIYENGQIKPSTREQCVGLERMAVWEPEHVEERIRDQYAGRNNKWVELLKMR